MRRNISSSLFRRLGSVENMLSISRIGLDTSIVSAAASCMPILSATEIGIIAQQEMHEKLILSLTRGINRPTPVEVL